MTEKPRGEMPKSSTDQEKGMEGRSTQVHAMIRNFEAELGEEYRDTRTTPQDIIDLTNAAINHLNKVREHYERLKAEYERTGVKPPHELV